MRSRVAARQSKRRVPLDAVLMAALALNVLYGVWRSPLLCLRRVHVIGAQGPDRIAIDAILQRETGRAALSIPGLSLETALQRLPEVESAEFSDNVFGSGRLRIKYRVPVARLGHTRMALAADGTVWRTRQSLAGCALVELPASALKAGLAMTRSAPLVTVADLAVRLAGVWPGFKGEVVLDDAGSVCLNRVGSGRVVLGAADAMDEKLSRLSGLLRERPDLFSGAIEVNLTAPAHPVFSHVTLGRKAAH